MPPEARSSGGSGLPVRWEAPARVGAFMSTRAGGSSAAPWAGWNLGSHVGDDAAVVQAHRPANAERLGATPLWLRQVHRAHVVDAAAASGTEPQADAAWTAEPGVACTAQVADCLPVLLAADNGQAVGAAHAGWRGLADGVVEAAVQSVAAAAGCEPAALQAWLGPCIGPQHFEVGVEVHEAFGGGEAFTPRAHPDGRPRWLADLPALARGRLMRAGVRRIFGGTWCTFSDPENFFSYRRDGVTGRMAAAIWLRY